MAVVKWTALVTGMKGTLRGSVLQFNAGGQIIRSNRQFNKPSNPRWNAAKTNAAAQVYSWRALGSTERAAWAAATVNYPTTDRYGNTHYSSPYTLYMRLNNPLNYHLGAPITTPAVPWSFSNLGVVAASANPSIPQVLLNFTLPYATNEYLLVNATAPLSPGRQPPAGLYTKIGLYYNVGSYSQDITADYLTRWGNLPYNIVIFFAIKLLSSVTGQLTPPYITSAYT